MEEVELPPSEALYWMEFKPTSTSVDFYGFRKLIEISINWQLLSLSWENEWMEIQ